MSKWLKTLTFVSRISYKLSGLFLLWFFANLLFDSKFKSHFVPTRSVYIEPVRNVLLVPKQNAYIESKQNVYTEKNPIAIATTPYILKSDKIKVMIMSSMPRSGSTLLGELLSNYSKGTKYYFEPDQYLEKNRCLESDKCSVDFFNDLIGCKGNDSFNGWFKNKRFFFKYYNEMANECHNSSSYKSCVDKINLIDDCRDGDLILIKNIRTRLKIVKSLLAANKDLKIIHLTRDPRGALWSIKRFNWGVSEESRCKDFLEDLDAYRDLKKQFPNRIMNISYELFSKQPFRETEKLFTFLFNINNIPETSKSFLKEHLSPETVITGVMSTVKNATSQYQLWRQKITADYLKKIETIPDCRESILRINHNLFKRLPRVRNENITLFKN